ncbi:N-6 DNA methylase [Streptosporangium pseudovulgare]|uniref:N-6 DNA methylase n=1 Tax=Streptosporangium pseudovulgare TaxID=35765 RepID=UPI001670C6F5|nr:N-6 DNA methylase [Streptosporangium pseudovulgare]
MANWERRHHDFPAPMIVDGAEVFGVAAVVAWLDRRSVGKKALGEQEPPGTTYGMRFRRALDAMAHTDQAAGPSAPAGSPSSLPEGRREAVARPDPESAVPRPPKPAHRAFGEQEGAEARLWTAVRRFLSSDFAHADRSLVLGLVYLRAVHSDDWEGVCKAPEAIVRRLETVIRGPFRDFRHRLDRRREHLLAEVVQAVDQAVSVHGGAQIFDFLLEALAFADGRRGGEFYTPRSVVSVLVNTVAPRPGERIHDPCCRSGELLASAAAHARRDGGRPLLVDGFTWTADLSEIARMNLMLHGVAGSVRPSTEKVVNGWLDTSKKFDVIVTNPPFNMSLDHDAVDGRAWMYDAPPSNNANFAWLQYVVQSLAPGGRAAVLMAYAAVASENPRERFIRTRLVEDGRVEAVIALPPQLFPNTGIPVTVWLLGRPREPRGEVLFIDASGLGRPVGRTRRILTDEDVTSIAEAVGEWRDAGRGYAGRTGFARSVKLDEVRALNHVLNPRSYVSSPPETAEEPDGGMLNELRRQLDELHARAADADAAVTRELRKLGL